MPSRKTTALKKDCDRALKYLYLATDESVAQDANVKINAYVKHLEKRASFWNRAIFWVVVGFAGAFGAEWYEKPVHHEGFGECQSLLDNAERAVDKAAECAKQRKSTLETIIDSVG